MGKQIYRKITGIILSLTFIFTLVPIIAVNAADSIGVKVLVEPTLEYDLVYNFSDGLARVYKDGKHGYIDKTGKVIIPLEYDFADNFSEGLAAVIKDGKDSYIDTTGKVVISFEYRRHTHSFSEGLALVVMMDLGDFKYGYIDKTGKVIIPLEYGYAENFSEGLALVRKDGKYGYIDKTGNVVISLEYDFSYSSFSEGLALVRKDGKYGYIDTTGKLIVPLEYDWAGDFSEGLAAVAMSAMYSDGDRSYGGVKYGYIDKTGKVIVPLEYAYTGDDGVHELSKFHQGIAVASVANNDSSTSLFSYGYIDKTGKVIVPMREYDHVNDFNEGIAVVRKNGKWGIVQMDEISATTTLTAKPTASAVLVNGANAAFDAYNIEGNNYFKLRDLAYILNSTEKQFEVGYDDATKAISLTSGKAYTAVGGEMSSKGSGNKTPTATTSKILLNGKEISLTAYNIDGNNYFKLRDIGQAFDFGVDWDGAKNTIVIDTGKGYTPEN